MCNCGNSYGTYGLASGWTLSTGNKLTCSTSCSGNSNEICGSFWAQNVYKLNYTCKYLFHLIIKNEIKKIFSYLY